MLAESYERLGFVRKAARVKECGSFLRFVECPSGHTKRLTGANFCRVRLCPMCSWRRSLVNAHSVALVAHTANERESLSWLFLTLTVKNVKGSELSKTLDQMFDGWNRLMQRRNVKAAIVGWFRALEVTRNRKKDEYHPHFHVLLAVRPLYFKSESYIKQAEWVDMWRDTLRVDYKTVVDIRKVKPKKDVQDTVERVRALESAIVETAKYPTKFKTILIEGDTKATDKSVEVLDTALHGRRLLAYGGLLKKIAKELKDKGRIQDSEDKSVDLVTVEGTPEGCTCATCGSDMIETLYRWNIGVSNYVREG